MRMEHIRRRVSWTTLLLASLFMSPIANAFSVKIHIYYANLIHDNLKKNFESTGRYEIDLVRPENSGRYKVTLNPEDGAAILAKPEYFRGGATGPDNTAFTGLTDPSHAAGTFPFQQCRGLLTAAIDKATKDTNSPRYQRLNDAAKVSLKGTHQEERAYALGCFLHGITDNVAHHMVNYFSSQTFTLTPAIRAARTEDFLRLQLNQDRLVPECNASNVDGSLIRGNRTCEGVSNTANLGQDFTNVVKHILVESNFEKAIIDGIGGAKSDYFKPSRLEHKLSLRLYREAYLNPDSPHYNMRTMMRPIIAQKDQYVREFIGKNIDKRPSQVKAEDGSTESLKDFDSVDFDNRRIDAALEFLKTGGAVSGVDTSRSLAPYQFVLLLPELLGQLQTDLTNIDTRVRNLAATECKGLGKVRPSCQFVGWLLSPFKMGNTEFKGGRLEYLVQSRKSALGQVLEGHIQSIQNLSNLLVKKEKSALTPDDFKLVFAPLDEALMKMQDTNDEFWPAWVRLFGIPKFFNTLAQKVKEKIVNMVRAKLEEYLLKLKQELIMMAGPLYEEYKHEIEMLKKQINASIEQAKSQAMSHVGERLRIEAGYVGEQFGMLRQFPVTVAHMNAFNSVAGVLANYNIVAADENVYPQARHMFAGPVSFDASYQLEYNQLAVCPDLKKVFYPCGTKVGDMLQPAGYAKCTELPLVSGDAEPAVECHAGNKFMYSANPNQRSCAPSKAEEFYHPGNSYYGSVTWSFPPQLAPQKPTCLGIQMPLVEVPDNIQ